MKKLTATLLAVAMILSLSACSNDSLEDENRRLQEELARLQEQQSTTATADEAPAETTTTATAPEPAEPVREEVSASVRAEIGEYLREIGYEWQDVSADVSLMQIEDNDDNISMQYFNNSELSLRLLFKNYMQLSFEEWSPLSGIGIEWERGEADFSTISVTPATLETMAREHLNQEFSFESVNYDFRISLEVFHFGQSYRFKWIDDIEAWEITLSGDAWGSCFSVVIHDYADVYKIGDTYYYIDMMWRTGYYTNNFYLWNEESDIDSSPQYTLYTLQRADNGSLNIHSRQLYTGELSDWTTAAVALIDVFREYSDGTNHELVSEVISTIESIGFYYIDGDGVRDVMVNLERGRELWMHSGIDSDVFWFGGFQFLGGSVNEITSLYRNKTNNEYVIYSNYITGGGGGHKDSHKIYRIEDFGSDNSLIYISSYYEDEAWEVRVFEVNGERVSETEHGKALAEMQATYEEVTGIWHNVNMRDVSEWEMIESFFNQVWEIFKQYA
jgi:uncharacterized lipoprotein YehR (DUF1307 family)